MPQQPAIAGGERSRAGGDREPPGVSKCRTMKAQGEQRGVGTVAFVLMCGIGVGASACGDDGNGLGDTTLTPTSTTQPMTTTSPEDDGGDDEPDDGNDEPDDGDDTTTDDGGDTTVAGSGDGSGGSSGGSSTGCMAGTEGCACTDDDPPCDEGLACEQDVCVAPLCPMDDEDPANDIPQDAIDLGEFDDGGGGDTIISQLSGSDDVDWWSYTCNDTALEELDPSRQITQAMPLRVCKFPDCVVGGNPTQFSCPPNATEESIDFGFLTGCCVTDGSSFNVDYNCPDSNDDSVIVYVRVDQAEEADVCVDYQIDFQC